MVAEETKYDFLVGSEDINYSQLLRRYSELRVNEVCLELFNTETVKGYASCIILENC